MALTPREVAPEQWIWNKDEHPPFHKLEYNAVLQKHHDKMFSDGKTGRVFVPLCGKTLDMIFLADQGHEVVGLEFSQVGIDSFFRENNFTYSEEKIDADFTKFVVKEKKITIFRGDLFNLKPSVCGQFDATWDRGSYVAINVPTREKYAALMSSLVKPSGRILMEKFVFDPAMYAGPPHNVTDDNLKSVFGSDFEVERLSSTVCRAPPNINPDMDWEICGMLLTRK